HDLLGPRDAQGLQVQPVRRRPRLRQGLSDGRHHLRRAGVPGVARAVGRDGDRAALRRPPGGGGGRVRGRGMATRHVVVGGGPAGLFAVETIRELDPQAEITLVADETPYSRMVLPYLIAREIPEEHVYTGRAEHWASRRVRPFTGQPATALDPRQGRLTLADGSTLAFDRCLLATGSSPIRPDIPGADGVRVHNLWTLADAHRTIEVVQGLRQGPARVIFIGAGFIGFIVLNALAKLGCALSVVELEDQILPRMLDGEAAALARAWLGRRGVGVHTGVRATGIGDAGPDKTVRLSDGTTLQGDLVVLAIGVRPNVEL